MVLGPPPSVRRLPDGTERWRYEAAGSHGEPVTFSFRPRPSTLAPANYELVRRPEYETLWYAAVEQWRKNDERPLNDGFSDDYVPRRFREGAQNGERRADRPTPRGERDDRRPAGNDGSNRARPQRPFYDEQGRQVMPSRDRNAAPYKEHTTRPAADRSIDMLFGLRPILEALNAGRTLDKIFLLRATKNSMTQDISGPGPHGGRARVLRAH